MNRRKMLTSLALTSAVPLVGYKAFGSNPPIGRQNILSEPARQTEVVNESDVIVCGGGPAGIAAAISAARHGAKTTLIEMHGCLGGIWTSGLLSNLIDYENKSGIMRELVERLGKSDKQSDVRYYDSELMKYVLDQMCLESGVEIRLHTRITGAYKNSRNRLEYIVTDSFSGREAWRSKIFIDTTGNGDLSAYSGCNFEVGQSGTGKIQPMSLMAILTGLDENELISKRLIRANGHRFDNAKTLFYQEIKRSGMNATYTKPSLFGIRPGLVAMMSNHQYGVSAFDADQISRATIEARAELNQMVDGLRNIGGVWKNMRLAITGAQIGIREGRRVHGHYMLTKEDLVNGAQFKDAVCKVTFPVDVHSLDKTNGGGASSYGVKSKPYDIPLRSLIAKDIDGLMMAGRCISGDFFAHASYRVTGNAVAMGEAAGQVGAQAALENTLPQKIKYTG